MVHIAKLITITELPNVPSHMIPFVQFHAQLEGIELKEDEKIAILQIEGTQSFQAFFLDRKITLEDIEKKLKAQDTELNVDAKNLLAQYLV